MIVNDGRVRAVYDMDSIAYIDEMRYLASIAVHWTYPARWPTRDEARAFVAEYLRRPLTETERKKLDAAAIYAMAYTARCEYRPGAEGPMVAALRAASDEYFVFGWSWTPMRGDSSTGYTRRGHPRPTSWICEGRALARRML